MVSSKNGGEEGDVECFCGGFRISGDRLKFQCDCGEDLITVKILSIHPEGELKIRAEGKAFRDLRVTIDERAGAGRIRGVFADLGDLSRSVEVEGVRARSMEFRLGGLFDGNLIFKSVDVKCESSEDGCLRIALPLSEGKGLNATTIGRGHVKLSNCSIERMELGGRPMNALAGLEIIGGL